MHYETMGVEVAPEAQLATRPEPASRSSTIARAGLLGAPAVGALGPGFARRRRRERRTLGLRAIERGPIESNEPAGERAKVAQVLVRGSSAWRSMVPGRTPIVEAT